MAQDAGMAVIDGRGSDLQPERSPGTLLDNLLADYGADRLRRIAREGFARLQHLLHALAGAVALGDAEDCARLLHRLRMQAADDGFHGFAEACRSHEIRARGGRAPVPTDVSALRDSCGAAWAAMETLLARTAPARSASPA